MTNSIIPPEMSEDIIKRFFFDCVINDDKFYDDVLKNKLKDMGYERFRDTFHKKLDNGNYILDAERLGLHPGDESTYVGEI